MTRFSNTKHDKWKSIILLSKQSDCRAPEQTVYFSMAVHRLLFCVAFHTTLLMAAWILLSRSDAPQWLWIQHCCCALHCEGHKRHFEIWYDRSGRPDWNESVEIWFKSHFKPPLNVVWIWFAKIAFHDFFFCCPDLTVFSERYGSSTFLLYILHSEAASLSSWVPIDSVWQHLRWAKEMKTHYILN